MIKSAAEKIVLQGGSTPHCEHGVYIIGAPPLKQLNSRNSSLSAVDCVDDTSKSESENVRSSDFGGYGIKRYYIFNEKTGASYA